MTSAEHRADRTFLMNPPNRFSEHVGDRQNLELREHAIGWNRNAVGHDHLLKQSIR